MLTRPFLAALVLGGLAGCTPTTQTTAPAGATTAAPSGPGVAECKGGLADATGQPASGMTVAQASGSSIIVQSPNGRRALCTLDGGRLVKFDMM